MEMTALELARLQFALTALYHFLFVPLTLGLILIIAIMETIYVKTGDEIWKKMVKFWGLLFGINFAMGVATGITMEFQFGTNWSYYSHYVGDIFGAPLAIEGLMAFFLEATFIGLFFFGWDKLSKKKHLMVTWLVFLGSNFSALWILVANGWMQAPLGSVFNVETMRMELSSFSELVFNPMAQTRFAHTLFASYVLGAVFVVAISSLYLLKNRNVAFAKRSVYVAAFVGFIASIGVAFFGDEQGYYLNKYQKSKMAAAEAIWETEDAPAPFILFAIPDQENKRNLLQVEIPAILGIIATRTTTEKVLGVNDVIAQNAERIRNGQKAYVALEEYKQDKNNQEAKSIVEANAKDLGYGLLLKKFVDDVSLATDEHVMQAAEFTIPNVATSFYSLRIMVGIGFYLIFFLGLVFYLQARDRYTSKTLYKVALFTLPLPWVATSLGWMLAEVGRQPWTIFDILPTFLSVSSTPASHVLTSLVGFVVLYTTLLVVDIFLLVKYIKLGPDGTEKSNKGE